MLIAKGSAKPQPEMVMEIITDPDRIAKFNAHRDRYEKNSRWWQAHMQEFLPRVEGKHVAIAGEEVFIADTPQEAIAMAEAVHPDDDGSFCRYVRPNGGPRIYAN